MSLAAGATSSVFCLMRWMDMRHVNLISVSIEDKFLITLLMMCIKIDKITTTTMMLCHSNFDRVSIPLATKFGAMLDQLTDRCGTMGLLVTLSYFYPKYMFWFQLSMSIDIACHWFYLHTTLLQGKTSHKFIDPNENPIMHIYYTNRTVLGFMCLFNELFYASLYLLYFTPGPLCKRFSIIFNYAPISTLLFSLGCSPI